MDQGEVNHLNDYSEYENEQKETFIWNNDLEIVIR